MKKKFIPLFFLLTLIVHSGISQVCGNGHLHNLGKEFQASKTRLGIKQIEKNRSSSTYIIPTVVHVRRESQTNSPDDQSIHEMLYVASNIFKAAGLDVTFKLATVDPDGKCTSAILRGGAPVVGSAFSAGFDSELKSLNHWPNNKYLNIYIVEGMIDGNGLVDNSVLGYAYQPERLDFMSSLLHPSQWIFGENFPAGSGSGWDLLDGVVIRHDHMDVITHELGHWMNLNHLWSDYENMNVNGVYSQWVSCTSDPEDASQGDFVEDTEPMELDPGECNLTLNTCVTSEETGTGSPVFDPVENIMSNSNSCWSNITPDQVARMQSCFSTYRTNIHSNQNLIETGVIDAIGGDVYITTHETWTPLNVVNNGIAKITGNLVIEPGAALTIKDGVEISFCETSSVIVKNGGALYIDKATFKSFSNLKWKGIDVWGGSNPGLLWVTKDLYVINAEVGIQNNSAYNDFPGGNITVNKGHFINNTNSIILEGNPNQDALGIYSSSFFKDDDSEFQNFITLNNIQNIEIYNSTFENDLPNQNSSIPEDFGVGILSHSSNFTVYGENTLFTGLGYGIKALNPGYTRPFDVRQSAFSDNLIGIYTNGIVAPYIVENKFTMDQQPGTINDPSDPSLPYNSFGVFLENYTSALTLQENSFSGFNVTQGQYKTVGVLLKNTGSINKVVRSNSFECNYACVGNKRNAASTPSIIRGTYFTCNTFEDKNADIYAEQYTNVLRRIQGIPVNNIAMDVRSAGNTFKAPIILTLEDPSDPSTVKTANILNLEVINDPEPEESYMQYYHINVPGFPGQNPFSIYQVKDEITSTQNSCEQEVGGGTDPGDPNCFPCTSFPDKKTDLIHVGVILDDADEDLDTNGDLMTEEEYDQAYLNVVMLQNQYDEILTELIQMVTFNPTYFQLSDLNFVLSNSNSFSGDVSAAIALAAQEDFIGANNLFNSLSSNYTLSLDQYNDVQDLRAVLDIITNSNLYNLTQNDIDALQVIAVKNQGNGSGWARNILSFYDELSVPTYNLKTSRSIRRGLDKNSDTKSVYKAYPNPSSNSIQILNADWANIKNFKVYDLNGVDNTKHTLKNDNTLDISDLNKGLYFIEIIDNNYVKHNLKFIKL